MAKRKPEKLGERPLRTDNRNGKENEGSRVDYDGEQGGQSENGEQVGEKDFGQRDSQRHEAYVVAAVQKNGVPPPQRGGATDDHGQHDEEIFVRDGGRKGIECPVAAQETDQ